MTVEIAQRDDVVLRSATADDAHIAAGAAYEAVGFDRSVPTVDLWRRL